MKTITEWLRSFGKPRGRHSLAAQGVTLSTFDKLLNSSGENTRKLLRMTRSSG